MTNKIKSIVYGLGGYDESKPNNNVIETEYYSDQELSEQTEAEAKATARAEILDRLGLSADEAAILLG